ncbi:MAG: hypothetical protein GVY10_01590 [Verrucomicrobia bacterium]|jgi:hypothetical protein|nr:hypothetical protein [Verrucomicrobiota bacterium]
MKEFRIHFIIIGAAKAGTTSLARWLAETPACCLSEPKETMFFGSERRHREGLDWYRRTYFAHWDGKSLPGEATPAYSDRTECPGTPERVHAHNPGARILYMVRDPVKRTESAWRMWASLEPHGHPFADHLIERARAGFHAWLEDATVFRHVTETSRYAWQWEAWKAFPASQRMTLFLEDLQADKERALRQVAQFLEIPAGPLLAKSNRNYNTAEGRIMKTALRKGVEGHVLWRSVKRFVPEVMKRRLLDSPLGTRKAELPAEGWNPGLKRRFLDEVREDALRLLHEQGRPGSFWDLELE